MRNITTIISAPKRHLSILLLVTIILCCGTITTGLALDTDIYAITSRPNVAILFDTSVSMSFGIYDSSINYREIYKHACEQTTDGYKAYDRDDPADPQLGGKDNLFYKKFIEDTGEFSNLHRDEIVLITGAIGVAVTTIVVDGVEKAKTMTGDPGDPQIIWNFASLEETGAKLVNNELDISDPDTSRITIGLDDEGEEIILLDESPLPGDRKIKLSDPVVYEDDTIMNKGLVGLMQAPGYHFTGYDAAYVDNPNAADEVILAKDGPDGQVCFLASANWVYMMLAYQLYTQKWDSMPTTDDFYNDIYKEFSVMGEAVSTDLNGDSIKDDILHSFPTMGVTWTRVDLHKSKFITSHNKYDGTTNYGSGITENCGDITQPDAIKIKLHFTKLDLYNGDTEDYITITDKETRLELGKIYNNSNGSNYFSEEYTLDGTTTHGIYIDFRSDDQDTSGTGFEIDRYEYSRNFTHYKMRRRIDAVRYGILAVIDDTRGTINWSLSGLDPDGDGADIRQHFNPTINDDKARQNTVTALQHYRADGATPLGEAMQDLFNEFHQKDGNGSFPVCSRQFTILISDGYPDTSDDDWNKLNTSNEITDGDGDGWMSDPTQPGSIPNYLDDVARYMYRHVFRNTDAGMGIVYGEEIDEEDAKSSFDNITTHTLSFAQDLPLLEDTGKDGGGVCLSANNEQQMINALRSLAMLAIKSASYVAPVVSVDTANKTQSGEWFYMAFFKPTGKRWVGNLKKYRLAYKTINSGNCPGRDTEEWVITDAVGYSEDMDDADANDAVNCEGEFLESSKSFWSDVADGGEVILGGVGAKLRTNVKNAFKSGSYYTHIPGTSGRSIYVLRNDGMKTQVLNRNSLTNAELGLGDGDADNLERYKITNYLHGYTYAVKDETDTTLGATSANYDPESYRNWPLGSLIHSTPMIVVYETVEDSNNPIGLKTFVVIGSNDGMLHVFDDATGEEIIAFIPDDILGNLQKLDPARDVAGDAPSPLFFIDGETSYYHAFDDNGKALPKQLIFGLRRGGSSYYSIDIHDSNPTNWVVKWHINEKTSGFENIGQSWSKMVLTHYRTGSGINDRSIAGVFSGGYDVGYDKLPNGTIPIISNNLAKPGAGLYIIDIKNSNTAAGGIDLLESYNFSKAVGLGISEMKYAIPANPAVIPDKYGLLDSIYFGDLGGQIWNIDYDNSSTPPKFDKKPRLVFKSNPGSDSTSGALNGGDEDTGDTDRRMFYSPTVTLMGGCNFVDSEGSARSSDTPVLIVGTGDRENPNRKDINNRIYMILDTEKNESTPTVLNETNLFNVTMDDIDIDNTAKTEVEKTAMRDYLATTNGWFIKLEDIIDAFPHDGEKILARPIIFSDVAYISSFTPITEDECHPKGQAKIYALNYCDGTAGVNFFLGNDDSGDDETPERFDYRDRYKTIGESIPSSPKIIIRDGKPEIFVGPHTVESPKLGKPIEIINWRELR